MKQRARQDGDHRQRVGYVMDEFTVNVGVGLIKNAVNRRATSDISRAMIPNH